MILFLFHTNFNKLALPPYFAKEYQIISPNHTIPYFIRVINTHYSVKRLRFKKEGASAERTVISSNKDLDKSMLKLTQYWKCNLI